MEYKKKQRPQKIRMLDGSVKTVMVDDSKTVGELLVTICSRIGMIEDGPPSRLSSFPTEEQSNLPSRQRDLRGPNPT